MPKISLIVAMANNNAIGKNNQLLWHLPDDLKYFKQMTQDKPVVMGHNTYRSIGRPLPKRENIVLTRNHDLTIEGCTIQHDVSSVLTHCSDCDEIMVIGGAQVYQLFLPIADDLYITLVDCQITGDSYFPEWHRQNWQEIERKHHSKDPHHPYAFDFVHLKNKKTSSIVMDI